MEEHTRELLETIRIISSRLDYNQLMQEIVDLTTDLVTAESGAIIIQNQAEEIEVVAEKNLTAYSNSIVNRVLATSEPIIESHMPQKMKTSSVRALNLQSVICLPLKTQTECKILGVLYLSRSITTEFSPENLDILSALVNHAAIALANAYLYEDKQKQLEIEQHKREILEQQLNKQTIIGNCKPMQKVLITIRKVAPTNTSVIIYGESGTGKEIIAKTIHNMSDRKEKPLVIINCGAIPNSLLESEFFGYERGAFTGAHKQTRGKFEIANGGTIFLDEVGDLPLDLQVKLLRVIQEGEIQRIGNVKPIIIDVRFISATHRNLVAMVQQKSFREDLYYRLKTIEIYLPPLRKRGDDVILLAKYFLDHYTTLYNKRAIRFSDSAFEAISGYEWKGNVRELQHKIEQALILTDNNEITSKDLKLIPDLPTSIPQPYHWEEIGLNNFLAQIKKESVKQALEKAITKTEAAHILQIPLSSLKNYINKFEIE